MAHLQSSLRCVQVARASTKEGRCQDCVQNGAKATACNCASKLSSVILELLRTTNKPLKESAIHNCRDSDIQVGLHEATR